jgi:hypothetical protein
MVAGIITRCGRTRPVVSKSQETNPAKIRQEGPTALQHSPKAGEFATPAEGESGRWIHQFGDCGCGVNVIVPGSPGVFVLGPQR